MSGFSLDLIVFADLLVYNLHVFDEIERNRKWFPNLYVYSPSNPIFKRFSIGLKSARYIERLSGLFGDSSLAAMQKGLRKIGEHDSIGRYRYPDDFEGAPLIIDYTPPEEVGTLP